MIEFAKKDFSISIEDSFVIGDSGVNDIMLAKSIGARAILVLTGEGKSSINESRHLWQNVEADYIVENVLDAVDYLLSVIRAK